MRIGLITLGCDKNTVDNEYLAGMLAARGHKVVRADIEKNDYEAVVITTCGFIEAAKGQSMLEIRQWAEAKRDRGSPARLVVAGCLTQRYSDRILAAHPEIDGLAGVGRFDELVDLIESCDPKSGHICLALEDKPAVEVNRALPRKRLESPPHAFLKIADGCDHSCAFCSIPLMKGLNVSVPPDILEAEARALLEGGARELNLVAQDLSLYGRDMGNGAPGLVDLLRRLVAIEGDFWIRLFYLYPGGVTDELLELAASEPKICNYFDIPLQHLSPPMLKAMRRPWGHVQGETLFERVRHAVPGVTLRTTFIVGFPGETEEDFDYLLGAMRRMRIDRVGAFIYSLEDGTRAYGLPGRVDAEVAASRHDRLMRVQQEIAFELNAARVGKRQRALIEGSDPRRGAAVARSQGEAAEIDGRIFVDGPGPKKAGQFADIEIQRADGYDLWARLA